MRRTAVLVTLAVVLSAPALASAWELGAKGAYWAADLSGEVRLDDGARGSTLDFKDDLGVGDEGFFFGEAWVQLGRHRLSVAGSRIEYSGSDRISGSIDFGGSTFPGSAEVDTSLEYTELDAAYQYALLDLENVLAGVSLGPVLQVKYLDGSVSLESGSLKESESFQVPIPMVGLAGHVGILADLLEVRARAVGMAYRGNTIFEVQGEVSLNPMFFLEIVGGYRLFAVDVEEGDLLLNYTQTGPYVGAAVKL